MLLLFVVRLSGTIVVVSVVTRSTNPADSTRTRMRRIIKTTRMSDELFISRKFIKRACRKTEYVTGSVIINKRLYFFGELTLK